MSASGWVTMILVLAVVWGGFLGFLIYALYREAGKSRTNPDN